MSPSGRIIEYFAAISNSSKAWLGKFIVNFIIRQLKSFRFFIYIVFFLLLALSSLLFSQHYVILSVAELLARVFSSTATWKPLYRKYRYSSFNSFPKDAYIVNKIKFLSISSQFTVYKQCERSILAYNRTNTWKTLKWVRYFCSHSSKKWKVEIFKQLTQKNKFYIIM